MQKKGFFGYWSFNVFFFIFKTSKSLLFTNQSFPSPPTTVTSPTLATQQIQITTTTTAGSAHNSRPMFRFSNDSTPNQTQLINGSTNSSSRTHVKRSISQVPTTDRRPTSLNNQILDNNFNSNSGPIKDNFVSMDDKQVNLKTKKRNFKIT